MSDNTADDAVAGEIRSLFVEWLDGHPEVETWPPEAQRGAWFASMRQRHIEQAIGKPYAEATEEEISGAWAVFQAEGIAEFAAEETT